MLLSSNLLSELLTVSELRLMGLPIEVTDTFLTKVGEEYQLHTCARIDEDVITSTDGTKHLNANCINTIPLSAINAVGRLVIPTSEAKAFFTEERIELHFGIVIDQKYECGDLLYKFRTDNDWWTSLYYIIF